jgi:hypothetical protein
MSVLSTYNYLKRNDFRNTKGLVLNLTPEEEALLEFRLIRQKNKGSYGLLGHNCTDPLESGLEGLGYDLGVNVTPEVLSNSLQEEGIVLNENHYPRNPELEVNKWYQTFPWGGWKRGD